MKNLTAKKLLSLLLCAAALFSLCAISALASSAPIITKYEMSSDCRTMTVYVKDPATRTSAVTKDDIDVSRMIDSFVSEAPKDIVISSVGDEPLSFSFMVDNIRHSGSDNTMKFSVGYQNIADSYTELNLALREYVQPVVSDDPYVNPMPVVQISREEMETVRPGEEFTLNITLTNTSKSIAVTSPVVTFAPSSAFIITDRTASKSLASIKRGETVTASIKLKALSVIESPAQSVEVRVSFNYDAGDAGTAQGSASETVLIPVETSGAAAAGAPLAVITREPISTVSANQSFTLTVNIKNVGTAAIERPVLSVSPDSSLAMMDATMSRLLDDIAPSATVQVPISLKALAQITSPSLGVALTLKYNYGAAGQETVSETVFIPAVVNADAKDDPVRIGGATPNVIISSYSYGDEPSVAAGSSFDLAMEFKNTSSRFTVENIVMTLSTGEGLAISASSNTMYYSALRPGDTQSETLGISVLPLAKTGSDRIDVSFSYEYVDTDQRCKVSTSQSIAIPVYQPDRFEVELPALPEFVTAYEEMYISLPYVNKGKSEISNVRAELVSPDGSVSSINGLQNLGNFASGSSGTIDFIFTPQMPGQVEFSFVITYEDPNAKEKTVEFPVSLTVEEPYYPEYDPGFDPGYEEPIEEKSGLPWWAWAAIAVVAAGVVIAVIVTVSRKKHPKKDALLDDFVWQGDQSGSSGGRE